MIKRRYIGIDLHWDNFIACFRDKDKELFCTKYDLSRAGIAEFCMKVSRYDVVAVEAVSNASYFKKHVAPFVEKVVFVAPGEFHIIGSSYKKTDLIDAGDIALYLSKDLLPLAREKSPLHTQLLSMMEMREFLVRTRKVCNQRAVSILIRHGIRVVQARLVPKDGYKRYVFIHSFDELVTMQLQLLEAHVAYLNQEILKIDQKFEELVPQLDGYKNIT